MGGEKGKPIIVNPEHLSEDREEIHTSVGYTSMGADEAWRKRYGSQKKSAEVEKTSDIILSGKKLANKKRIPGGKRGEFKSTPVEEDYHEPLVEPLRDQTVREIKLGKRYLEKILGYSDENEK